ncbi:nucleosome assembly protein 1-like 1 [Drosophila subpulchrella]|uniref:nucleosome assembly protein 1-like 1 n=1 Tax=Drosophila subpulchrella TaxID=1486046 RepID=UPI0018A166F5|nr:nucleosome assembly protein 1-like 1 [Drosophila subpulchrella]
MGNLIKFIRKIFKKNYSAKQTPDIDEISGEFEPAYVETKLRRQYLQTMVDSLPISVQSKLVIMKNLQLEQLCVDKKFYDVVFEMEIDLNASSGEMYRKRRAIIEGTWQPPDTMPNYKVPDPLEPNAAAHFRETLAKFKSVPPQTKGIPDFWITVFRNTCIAEMVQEQDVPALRFLVDISIHYGKKKPSFMLKFHFAKNHFFKDSALTKTYFLKTGIDNRDPFSFEGPQITHCRGCEINWEPTMNLTTEVCEKKQRHRGDGDKRIIYETYLSDSFFNFFNPPLMKMHKDDDSEKHKILRADFKIAQYLRTRIIPKAVLYFTGDIVEANFVRDEDDTTDEDSDDEDENDYYEEYDFSDPTDESSVEPSM